jgi:hypothetical protein
MQHVIDCNETKQQADNLNVQRDNCQSRAARTDSKILLKD